MTAEQIQSWSSTKHTPEEIDQALLDRWQRDQLVNIRPAKYPSLTTLSRLWGHIERVRYLDRGQLEPRRLYEPLELEPLDLPADVSEVFVSFSALDLELAVNVRRILANHGIRAWLYEERIKQRDLIFEQVRSAISYCSGVIGLLTRNSVGSAWVYTELAVGWRSGVPIYALFHASDLELMRLIETWKPGATPAFNHGLIDPLEEAYREKVPQHRAEVYRMGVVDLLTSLERYSGIFLFPERPAGWKGHETLADFRAMTRELTSRM